MHLLARLDKYIFCRSGESVVGGENNRRKENTQFQNMLKLFKFTGNSQMVEGLQNNHCIPPPPLALDRSQGQGGIGNLGRRKFQLAKYGVMVSN